MTAVNPNARQRSTPRGQLGHPALYFFNGKPQPVRLLKLGRDEAIVAFEDGRVTGVELHRLRLS